MNKDYDFRLSRETMAEKMAERVHQYTSRVTEYTRATYNETEVRVEFVNPCCQSYPK